MADKKTFIVVTYHHGTRKVQAEAERFARRTAIARGWWVKKIEEKPQKEEKKAA